MNIYDVLYVISYKDNVLILSCKEPSPCSNKGNEMIETPTITKKKLILGL